MSRPRATAVLFDMDGVLVDSEPIWYDVEFALVERLGGSWSKQHQAECIGGTIDATCRYIALLTGTDRPPAELQAEILADITQRFAAGLTVHEGAFELIDAVRARSVKTALVSSSFRVLVDAALRWLGPERFDVTVAGDEVQRGKPHPEPYLVACELLGVAPGDAVVIEDAMSGVRSAEAAGSRVVAVPSVRPIEPTLTRRVITSVAEIDPDWLLA